ncbi:molybdopterin-dependent oxidoreductase [Sphingopyxis sp.]|uniref:molybdopterin-dependent oxidoreductase n=1 Tax=Sphingopyxis sp. TaxID=1908224 RepID=UPI002FC58906
MSPSRTIRHQVCPLCEAACGLLIETEDTRIVSIAGNPNDRHSRGHICPKGVALQDLHGDPDRIREPMIRTGRNWEPVTWDAALDLAAERLDAIRRKRGRDAVGIYSGNPSAHNIGSASHFRPLLAELGTRQVYSSASIDIFPNMLVSLLMYGHQFMHPVPDLERTDFLLMLGANPLVSNGSLMTAPGFARHARALRARGGRFIVIDPRKTETAKMADAHHFIVPGTDAELLLAMIHVLFRDKLVKPGHLSKLIDGLDDVEAAIVPFTPERAAKITGVGRDVIVALATDFARSATAACYGRIGISVQKFGTLAHWAIQLLNLLTGNLDRIGGTLLAKPAVARLLRPELAAAWPRQHSRVGRLPGIGGALPVAALADEILAPGPGQLRALIVFAGNPASSLANTAKVNRALSSLECLVSIDIYLNETARHAHIFLPSTSPLERGHYPTFSATFAVRNFANYSPPVFEPSGNVLPDWQILDELTRRLAALSGSTPPVRRSPEDVLAEELASGWHPGLTFEALLAEPDGIDLGPLTPSLPERLLTANGRINVAPTIILKDLERLRAERDAGDSLLLIGRRSARSNNSWMHNSPRLMARRPDHYLQMHPRDMATRGVCEGEEIRLRSETGEMVIAVQASEEIMPGVVCLPHGWGHRDEGMRLGVAAALPGENFNLLVDEQMIDVPSAGSVVQGIPVQVFRRDTD